MELKLAVIGGKQSGTEIPIRHAQFVIGRGEECHLRPQNHLVSRRHCAILVEGQAVFIEDFGSTNGTFVNDERIQKRCELKNGDHLKVAGLEFEVRLKVPVEAKRALPPVQEKVPVEVKRALPPVQGAARKVIPVAKADDDLEISSWLAEDDDESGNSSATGKSVFSHDTVAGHRPSEDTTTLMPVQDPNQHQQAAGKEDPKGGMKKHGHLKVPPKPLAENSRAAAEEMLRQFFPRKKP
jgi:pSer/pThr/pTyr-binding forkhead associated (FHA) protein